MPADSRHSNILPTHFRIRERVSLVDYIENIIDLGQISTGHDLIFGSYRCETNVSVHAWLGDTIL